jgi:hypothetical protein
MSCPPPLYRVTQCDERSLHTLEDYGHFNLGIVHLPSKNFQPGRRGKMAKLQNVIRMH